MKDKCSLSRICRKGSSILLLVLLLLAIPAKTLAATDRSSYFDWGPYYSNQAKVLGITFSSLENLPKPTLPQDVNTPPATGLLPGNPFYFIDKLTENAQLAFTFNNVQKEELRLNFAQERLSEAKTLTDQGKYTTAQDAISSYQDTMHTIAQNSASLVKNNTQGSQELVSNIERTATANTILTQNIALSSPPTIAKAWSQATEASQQVMDTAADTRGDPPIPQDLSVSISKLKEEGLLTPEESNKIHSLNSRGEVRDELNKLSISGQFPTAEVAKLDQAIATNYPDTYKQTNTILQFAELRAYETLPPPTQDLQKQIKSWQDLPGNPPPPAEIRPYLYQTRAQELANQIDLTRFPPDQQTEVARFYPQAAIENPTFTSQLPQAPTPTPSPKPSPSPAEGASQTPTPSPLPTPPPPSATPYLTEYSGPLPGDGTYFLKSFGEGASLLFAFDPAKRLELEMQYADERLKEANALGKDIKKTDLYGQTLKQYQESMDSIAKSVKSFSGSGNKKLELADKLESEAARHSIVFEKGLLSPIANNQDKILTAAIQEAQDAMDTSADIQGRPALPQTLTYRLQDMKAQGLILPEEVEQLTQAKTRGDVRDKIRKLVGIGAFPSADAKKLDEAQLLNAPGDYNQLTEVRKVEELQNLRSVQTDLAQTPFLKSTTTTLAQKEVALTGSFDYALIDKIKDLGGRENLIKTYEKLAAVPHPINNGQFGIEATPGAQLVIVPKPQDALLSACPEGAVFKQFEGCAWADNGKKINDYDQYRCEGPRQYYSFAARKCVAFDNTKGWNNEDAQPLCPVGYTWSWQAQSCQVYTRGGLLPLPSPSPEPEPTDDKQREERSKSCPGGASYSAPNGCVWDKSGKSVYDPEQYRCSRGNYYSFEQGKCVSSPKEGQPYPKDTTPDCKEEGTYWSWNKGKCINSASPSGQNEGEPKIIIDEFKPPFIAPNSPFYIIKQAAERAQLAIAFTSPARAQVSLSQAKERLVEAADALKKDDEQGFKKALNSYTSMMQNLISDTSKQQLTESAKIQISKHLSEEAVKQNLMLEKLSAWATQTQDTDISAAVSVSILGVDKAADIAGEPPIPGEVKSKIEALPEKMISEEDKKKLLEMDSRVEARVKLQGLITNGILTQTDTAFLNEGFDKIDQNTRIKVEELKKLEEIADAGSNKEKLEKKIDKNEDIAQKLAEFEKTFAVGQEIPAEIRPYVRLTRINEISQTIRPDIVRLDDFQNRKDVVLAVATLQEEFKPTYETWKRVEEYRRRNPNIPLPPDLARAEALSYSLGVRQQAGPCYLPTPPFPANTPCPAPGAAIPITSFGPGAIIVDEFRPGWPGGPSGRPYSGPSVDKEGKPLVYGQGPTPANAGICPEGYHWMYDSGGWCMSNGGSYNSSYNYTPTGTGPGYTPYSPYYTAPGAPPATYGYNDPNFINLYSPLPGGPTYNYSPSYYYGTAPTTYTTTPPAGTVPGTGPAPTSPGQCPSGYHWMSDSGGWCMSDGPTYVPGGPTPTGPYSPNLTQSSCGPGYYWDGRGCIRTSPTDTYGSCSPPGGGCGYNSYWDYGSCSCRGASTSGGTSAGSSCSPPSGGCGSGWYDYGSCSCKAASSQGCYNVSASSCGSGFYWDSGACTCRSNSSTSTSSGGGSSGSSSSGSCPSGYHWMSDSGGWCMSDGAAGSSSSSSTGSSGSTTSSGSCPSGSHWMSDNGGYCMSDGGGATQTQTETQTQPQSAPTSAPQQQTQTAPTPAP